jgi:hypothetical protein
LQASTATPAGTDKAGPVGGTNGEGKYGTWFLFGGFSNVPVEVFTENSQTTLFTESAA